VNSSPAVAGELVYVGGWDYNVYCLNASSGAKIWSYATQGHVNSSPAIANGVVYVGSWDHKVYAFGTSPIETVPSIPAEIIYLLAVIIAVVLVVVVIIAFKRKKH
jgi:outer membrane protein assembly factor BamB